MGDWELEERVCKCGCKKRFRTLKNSDALWASCYHRPEHDPSKAYRPLTRAEIKRLILDEEEFNRLVEQFRNL